jgi:hypothetical protein
MSNPSYFNNDDSINQNEYEKYQKLQKELDMKMEELHRLPGSFYSIQQEQYTNTIMIGVVWSMLATASLYYVFKNV